MGSKEISRRSFLKGATLGIAGLVLTSGLGITPAFARSQQPPQTTLLSLRTAASDTSYAPLTTTAFAP